MSESIFDGDADHATAEFVRASRDCPDPECDCLRVGCDSSCGCDAGRVNDARRAAILRARGGA